MTRSRWVGSPMGRSSIRPATTGQREGGGGTWSPGGLEKERKSEPQNTGGEKGAVAAIFPEPRGGGWGAARVPPPAAMFHPHSGHTGSSEAMRRHLGQIRMATCIIAYFVDPTDRKVYPKGRSMRSRRGTTRSKRAAHSKARGNPAGGQGHVHGAGPRHPARGDRGARPLGGRRHARQHLPPR